MSTSPGPVAALTGATGFLGRYVVNALIEGGWDVRILARSLPVHPQLNAHALTLVPGNLEAPAALRRLCAGADAVIHMAGAIKGTAQSLQNVNVDGTAALVEAWQARAPAARFIYVSSLTARAPSLSAYGASKHAGESVVRGAKGTWVIVRPPAIYGPWDRETLAAFKAARLPLHPVLNGPEARLSMIHVADAAAAIAALSEDNGHAGALFELHDPAPQGHDWGTIIGGLCGALGRKPRPLRIPERVLHLAAAGNENAQRLLGREGIFNKGKAREILHPDWVAAPTRHVPETLWTPRIPLYEGLKQTAHWYQQAGWL